MSEAKLERGEEFLARVPIDTVEKLDAGQVLKMARLALTAAWTLADR